jgi:hypothetical protein
MPMSDQMSDQKEVQPVGPLSVGPWSLIILGAGGLATVVWAFVLFYGAWNFLHKSFS